MKKKFKFFNPGKLIDGDLELVLTKKTPADPVRRYVSAYEFEMRRLNNPLAIGNIRLRIGSAIKLRYPGHIGYEVKKRYRGHRYAARSCRLILPLARTHGLNAVWLTVDPKMFPLRKPVKSPELNMSRRCEFQKIMKCMRKAHDFFEDTELT